MANEFQKYGIRPSKKLGQNFLTDQNISAKIASQIGDYYNRTILEIGPGLGAITEHLVSSEASKVVVVEYDRACLKYLEDLQSKNHKLQVVAQDALKIKESDFVEEGKKLTIISNLPYNISVVLLLKWLEQIEIVDSMVLMFQKEVADRIVAKPGNKSYGIVSVLAQYLCDFKLCFDVPPTVFFPPPKVMSAVVKLTPKTLTSEEINKYKKLKLLCNTVFNQRRKMLRNTLKSLVASPDEVMKKLGLSADMRPEELSVENFADLAGFIN